MDGPLTETPQPASVCDNCGQYMLHPRCGACGWVPSVPSGVVEVWDDDGDDDDDDPERTWPLEPPPIIDPPGGEAGH